jgi:hypothetical protein
MEASMKPSLGEKEVLLGRDRAVLKSMEGNRIRISPPEERPANQHQKYPPALLLLPTPTWIFVFLASAPTPRKGITGTISNTVSKVFGGSREELESESDTGEPLTVIRNTSTTANRKLVTGLRLREK